MLSKIIGRDSILEKVLSKFKLFHSSEEYQHYQRAREKYRYLMNSLLEDSREQGLEEGREQGIEKGREEERVQLINTMLKNGADLETISKLIGLSANEIKKLIER